MHDLLTANGTVVDGTGAPGRAGDVAVTGGVITAIGRREGGAARVSGCGAARPEGPPSELWRLAL